MDSQLTFNMMPQEVEEALTDFMVVGLPLSLPPFNLSGLHNISGAVWINQREAPDGVGIYIESTPAASLTVDQLKEAYKFLTEKVATIMV